MSEPNSIRVQELVNRYPPDRSRLESWTWEDEARDIFARECLCCGQAGHYQRMLEAYIAEHGTDGLSIYLRGGRVRDGHHRVVAAIRLGISSIPLETKSDAKVRWIRDHGYVDWDHRKSGDRCTHTPAECRGAAPPSEKVGPWPAGSAA